jgi:geranylgeranyl diphosphate synthase type II
MASTAEFLDGVKTDVDSALDRLIPSEIEVPQNLHSAIRWSLFAGGKRIRPAIVIAVGETLGTDRSRLLATSAAMEMVHTYSLIHDDLPSMDNDDLRRGRATCHRQFGEATAILAGDVLQTLAFKAIADDASLSADIRIKIISQLASASGTPDGMASGQQLDLNAEGVQTTIDDVERIHRRKTGALIISAATAGASIAGAAHAEVESVTAYAEKLGLLFQITDDLLDVTQATIELGKTAGKDASSNKATYPAHYGIYRTRKLASRIRDEAASAIAKLNRDTEILKGLANFIIDRTN